MIASNLPPAAFLKRLTDGSTPIVLPKLFFVELKLGDLATNPRKGSIDYLPYANIGHLRDCLEVLSGEYEKRMKTVQRIFSGHLLYRTIESGFYIGSKDEIIFYRYPTLTELEDMNYEFFRSIWTSDFVLSALDMPVACMHKAKDSTTQRHYAINNDCHYPSFTTAKHVFYAAMFVEYLAKRGKWTAKSGKWITKDGKWTAKCVSKAAKLVICLATCVADIAKCGFSVAKFGEHVAKSDLCPAKRFGQTTCSKE